MRVATAPCFPPSVAGTLAAFALARLVLLARSGGAPDVHPKYARVDGKIETVWQRPRGDPKGIFFIGHGCTHQATDIFTYEGPDGWRFEACKTSNYGSCLGLPEEVQLRQVARSRGYLVMGVSGGSGRQSCWDMEADAGRVATAVSHVRREEHLPEVLPVLAMGASSGGAFMGALAAPIAHGGLPGLQCIVPMIMGLHGSENRGVPSLFVHMPRDKFTAVEVRHDLERFKQQGIRAGELQARPKPVSVALLSRCLKEDVAADVLRALYKAELLDAVGFLKEDARRGLWVDPARKAIDGRSPDSLMRDESCLAEEMNLAWAMHEFTSEYSEQIIDFCENQPSGLGGSSDVRSSRHPASSGDGSGQLRGASRPPGDAPVLRGMQQVLIFDAGSSGTRVHVFNMLSPRADAHVPTLDLSVRDKQTLKIKPGLSHFARAGDLAGTESNIQQLLDFANKLVPAARRLQTPVLLKATAGLRAVSESQAEAVLAQVRRTLEASGYLFRSSWADIIQGKEEAGLAWVAANYLQGTFDGQGDAPSLGIIEMGGGSTQVSFQVDASAQVASSDNFVFKTAMGRQYHLYAHSYLGYGQDYAQAKLRKTMPKLALVDPCYPKGYTRLSSESFVIKGSGNASGCRAAIEASLFASATDAPGHYADEQPLHGAFLATQNFFFVQRDLGLVPMVSSMLEMEEASHQSCMKELMVSTHEPDKPNTCFGLCYQVVMLQSLKIPDLSGVTLKVANAVQGADVDWALGAALVHVLERPPEEGPRPEGGLGISWMGILTTLLASFALFAVSRIAIWSRLRKMIRLRELSKSPDATKVGRPSPAE